MGERLARPMCSTQLGADWIDEGTMCRSRSSPPGPIGLQSHHRGTQNNFKEISSTTVSVRRFRPIAGAEEITVSQMEYEAALRHVFPSHYFDQVAQTVDGIGQRAAQRAVNDPRFVQAVQSRNLTLAGTLFHSAAAQEARAVPASALPAGWTLQAEHTIQVGAGGSRADLLLCGPAGQIVEFDWKTTARSALSTGSRREMVRHAGQITTNISGTLTTQESRSWIDYVRPLLPGI